MGLKRSHRVWLRLWCCLVLALGVLGACLPCTAFARSFQVDGVEVDATIGSDGSLAVIERRTYDFSGAYNGIYWDVPRGSYEGRSVAASIDSVGVWGTGASTTFEMAQGADAGSAGTYELSEEADHLRLKINWPAEDERVTFEVRYQLSNLAVRWSDTAELYWQYVPADEESGAEWHNIVATVHLPVPEGEVVAPGENVRAWGHGPLDGEVSFAGNAVTFTSPAVGSAEFLEARVAFPSAWLSEVSARDEAHLDAILSEEDQWAKDANAKRRRARIIVFGIPGILGFAGIASFLAALIDKKRLFKKKDTGADFKEKYFRDVPSNDHPAVLGMLYRHGNVWRDDLTASIMRLTDIGSVRLDMVDVATSKKHSRRVTSKRMCRLTQTQGGVDRSGNMRAGTKGIDDAATAFLFNTVAGHVELSDALRGSEGEPYVLPSFFERVADDKPSVYENGYHRWERAVKSAYEKRGFEKSAHNEGGIYPGILGLADFALFAVLGLVGWLFDVPSIYLLPAMGICFAAGIYCVWNTEEERVVTYSAEAMELRARLEALKNWLTDFTHLREAIPTDVVLWNRLLVMATVLGVAQKVVEQLKVAMPELLDDEEFMGSSWYARDLDDGCWPAEAFDRSFRTAGASVSNQLYAGSSSSAARSHDSSSGGSGGGFSSGGGGGFSGGGRGGAF